MKTLLDELKKAKANFVNHFEEHEKRVRARANKEGFEHS